tara:strand:+ start:228 stop:878 length:651 start_codon:yes stop_codon:yes gene_type:complete
MAIDRDLGRRSPPMRSPGTMDDRARDIAPDGVPFNFYNSGRMDPPRMPRVPMPMPMPNPFPDPRQPMPMPRPMPINPNFGVPPGGGPFRPNPFPDQMPRGRQGIMEMSAATVDPSDYRTIIKMIEQGLDPEDYIASSGIMGALPQETQMAELTQGQKDFIRSQGGDQFQSRESLMDKIMTPQGGFDRGPFLGIFGGGQEPTTRKELDAFLNSGMVG